MGVAAAGTDEGERNLTNSQLTSNEHEERLRHIRANRQVWYGGMGQVTSDIDFLLSLLTTIRQEERRAAFKEAVAIIAGQPTTYYIYSGAMPMAAETFRDNAIGAIEATIAIEAARLKAATNETKGEAGDG